MSQRNLDRDFESLQSENKTQKTREGNTMAKFKSFQMFLILMIPFTAVTLHRAFSVRVGDEATLPCKDVKDNQDKCNSTTWIFNYLRTAPSVTLFQFGKIHREAESKSDRLNVTEKCSLVIKKVTYEDAGRYTCRQFDESGKQVTYSSVNLIVTYTAVTHHRSFISVKVGDEATLPCEDVTDLPDKCLSTTWAFDYLTTKPAVPLIVYGKITREAASKSDRLSVTEKCCLVIKKVTDEDAGRYTCRQFISGQIVTNSDVYLTVVKRDNVAIPPVTTTKRTTKATTRPTTTTKRTTKATTLPPTTDPAAAETSLNAGCWIRLIFVLVGVAALSLIVVSVNIWTRTKGSKTHGGKKQHSNEDDDVVTYEHAEDVSAPVRFHRSTNQL
ncbi:uncharacterized protein LOC110970760 isoform X4 [Acanthochromis polyacanthus]|uniref:uncharacterized protein LOC110970760 isoform X4 n=1 Tax=Acanthochromis polyacanthus TaxID=80966 RepID=UPI002234752C|nr:uncharacterized protein LOC110970760 isoform X4 [Acanthochromis polyacanthus]